VVGDVPRQVSRLPDTATHLIVSVGGNDALEHGGLLAETDRSAAEGFVHLAEIQGRFREEYQGMLRAILAAGKPTALCTIYDSIPGLPPPAVTALSVFNDVILREGFRSGLPILDLRLICDEARDYSSLSPIEPSAVGGLKIVQAITRLVTGHDFGRGQTVVYGK
jgi:hypothetical protein